MTSSGELSPSSITPSQTPVSGLNIGSAAPKYGTVIPNRIFVGGISGNTSEAELKAFFSAYGQVKDSKIIADRAGVSKGYGFVTFETQEDAEKIIKKESDNLIFKDRKLNIGPAVRKQQAFPRPDAPFSPVMFTNGIPYTFQNGMAIFHGQDGTQYHAISQAQPSAYQTVMAAAAVPQQHLAYLTAPPAATAAQYSQAHTAAAAAAYQSAAAAQYAQLTTADLARAAPQHWAAAAQGWRWPTQCATPALTASPATAGYMYAPTLQQLTPEMIYASAAGPQQSLYQTQAELNDALIEAHNAQENANANQLLTVGESQNIGQQRCLSEISFVDAQGTPSIVQVQTPVSKAHPVTNYYASPQVTPSPRKHYSTPIAALRNAKAPRLVSKVVNGTTINVVSPHDGLTMATQLVEEDYSYVQPLTPPPTPQQLHRK